MMIIIALVFVWLVYIILCAITEAHYQDELYFLDREHKNLHPVYFIERGIMLSFIYLETYNLFMWDRIIFCFALCFIYPFFHDGMLYSIRNYLNVDVYKKRWFANKELGKDEHPVLIELGVGLRTTMAIIGIIFIIGVILDK